MSKHEHGVVDHIVPIRLLVGTCLALLVLTAVTVWVAELDFNILNIPSMNLLVALAIASFKVFIVSMIFMHLRWDRSFIGYIFVVACLLVFLFIGLALMDTAENEPDIIPGNSAQVQQKIDALDMTAPSGAHGGTAHEEAVGTHHGGTDHAGTDDHH